MKTILLTLAVGISSWCLYAALFATNPLTIAVLLVIGCGLLWSAAVWVGAMLVAPNDGGDW